MDRIGKFVVREVGDSIIAYRIVGYDFEQKQCMLRRIPFWMSAWSRMTDKESYSRLLDSDKIYDTTEIVKVVQSYIDSAESVLDVITSLEYKTTELGQAACKKENERNELKHLYNALSNIVCSLYYYQSQIDSQAKTDYTKALRNIKKRFYFYYGDAGKHTVDFLRAIATDIPEDIRAKKTALEFTVNNQKRLLTVIEDYLARVPVIQTNT